MDKNSIIEEIHLKSMGFKKRINNFNGKEEWQWGSYTTYSDISPDPIYDPILRYSDGLTKCNVNKDNCDLTIIKKIKTAGELKNIINFASQIIS